jgi:hypothetical protein
MAMYQKQESIRVTIKFDRDYLLLVSRGLALNPSLFSASTPKGGLLGAD